MTAGREVSFIVLPRFIYRLNQDLVRALPFFRLSYPHIAHQVPRDPYILLLLYCNCTNYYASAGPSAPQTILKLKVATNLGNRQSPQRPTQDHLLQWPEHVASCYLCWDMYNPTLLILRVMLNGTVDKHVNGVSIATRFPSWNQRESEMVSISINAFSFHIHKL
jgi:hypothetical protein